jgi:predicted AAA+ superfamily ATPase
LTYYMIIWYKNSMLQIEDFNFHWRKNFFYNFPRKRAIYNTLKDQLGSEFILILYGQRRTGKTTIVKQLMDELIQSGIRRQNILYYSFDKAGSMVSSVLKQYEQLLNDDFRTSPEVRYIFLDEIQKAKDWDSEVKYYYDNFKRLKMFLTGSSSLFIKGGQIESLAGRTLEYKLDPLDFVEYLRFKNSDDMLENIDLFKEQLNQEYINFMKRPYIDLIPMADADISKVLHTLLDKIIFQDIPARFPVEEPELLQRLMRIVCSQPGSITEYNSLAQELGRSRTTISNYFYYLEQAFLIKKLYNFSTNLLTSEKKLKKVYPAAAAFFFYSGQWPPEMSYVFENSVVLETGSDFFFRDNYKNEVDIIVPYEDQTGGKKPALIPIEIKFSDNIKSKALNPIQLFMGRNKIKQGIIVTKNLEKVITLDECQLHFIPAWLLSLKKKEILHQ